MSLFVAPRSEPSLPTLRKKPDINAIDALEKVAEITEDEAAVAVARVTDRLLDWVLLI